MLYIMDSLRVGQKLKTITNEFVVIKKLHNDKKTMTVEYRGKLYERNVKIIGRTLFKVAEAKEGFKKEVKKNETQFNDMEKKQAIEQSKRIEEYEAHKKHYNRLANTVKWGNSEEKGYFYIDLD